MTNLNYQAQGSWAVTICNKFFIKYAHNLRNRSSKMNACGRSRAAGCSNSIYMTIIGTPVPRSTHHRVIGTKERTAGNPELEHSLNTLELHFKNHHRDVTCSQQVRTVVLVKQRWQTLTVYENKPCGVAEMGGGGGSNRLPMVGRRRQLRFQDDVCFPPRWLTGCESAQSGRRLWRHRWWRLKVKKHTAIVAKRPDN